MKKLIKLLVVAMMVLTIVGCSSQEADKDTTTNTNNQDEIPNLISSDDVLIAYFSWSGNTKTLANMIHEKVGGELYEITTLTSYTDDYDDLLDQAQQEQRDDARPEVANQIDGFEKYEVIFVGYPIWWNDTPMAILSFLEQYDFTEKTVIPFCTHGSGGFGNSIESITGSASRANILDGFEVSGSNVESANDDVIEWIDGLNLN